MKIKKITDDVFTALNQDVEILSIIERKKLRQIKAEKTWSFSKNPYN